MMHSKGEGGLSHACAYPSRVRGYFAAALGGEVQLGWEGRWARGVCGAVVDEKSEREYLGGVDGSE